MTTTGPVPVRPLLAPVDEESAPMEDDEGGEDESMQGGGRRREETQVQEEREPALEPGYRSWFTHCVRGRGGMIPTGQEEEGENQGIIHTSQLTTDSSRRTTLMIRQIREVTRSSQELRRSVGSLWRCSSGKGQ